MTSWKKLMSIFGALALIVAMGAGCVLAPSTFNDSPEDGSTMDDNNNPDTNTGSGIDMDDDDDYTTGPCPTGTKRYVSAKENVTFCYPEKVGDEDVTIDDGANSVTIKVGDEVARVIMVEKVAEDVDREEKVLDYAADPTDDSITCEADAVANEKGREVYILVGKDDGTQSVSATDACIDSTALNNALNDEPVGRFFFYDDEDELIIVSGSQDAVLGALTDEFESTIWPKN